MLDAFNEGWSEFEGDTRKGIHLEPDEEQIVNLEDLNGRLAQLVHGREIFRANLLHY
jgi:hypothetical protein